MKNSDLISALIYTGVSLLAAGLFIIATLSAQYSNIDRFGGAAWVFILSMIILMPVIIPAVKKRRSRLQTAGISTLDEPGTKI